MQNVLRGKTDSRSNLLVSVIVPCYNSEKYLAECLESVLKQTYPNIELITIYSTSTDRTLSILRKYRDLFFKDKMKIIESSVRLNPAQARNLGLKQAKGYYLAFLDHDDYWSKTKIETQVRVHLNHPRIGLTYTDLVQTSDEGEKVEEISVPEWNFEHWLRNRYIKFSSVFLRKKLIDEVGYFDESEELFGVEDFDFLIRLAKVTEFKKVKGFHLYYRVSSTAISRNWLWRLKARENVFKKHNMKRLYIQQCFECSKFRVKLQAKNLLDKFPRTKSLLKKLPKLRLLYSRI